MISGGHQLSTHNESLCQCGHTRWYHLFGVLSCRDCGCDEFRYWTPRDRAEAVRRTDEAIEKVDAAASVDWKGRARQCLETLAKNNETFTTDLLWDIIEHPREPRALGPVVRGCVSDGLIVATDDFVCSNLPSNHRRPVRVWRSLVYR